MKAIILLQLLLVACGALMSHGASAQDAGTIKTAKGEITVVRGSNAVKGAAGLALQTGDEVRTGAASSVGITLRDNTILSAGPNSTLQIDKYSFDPKTQKGSLETTVKRGSLLGISGAIAKNSPEAVRFKTASMTLGVRGTEFIIETSSEQEK